MTYSVYTKTIAMGSRFGPLFDDLEEAKAFANQKSTNDKWIIYREVFQGKFYQDTSGRTSHTGKIKSIYRNKIK